MSIKGVLIAALGGVAAAAVITNYLGTESGKRLLETSKGTLKDLANKATDMVKTNLQATTGNKSNVQTSQPV